MDRDIELLGIQQGMGLDGRGRIAGRWGATIATARDGQLFFLGSELSEELAYSLEAAFRATPHRPDPTVTPVALAQCERLLRSTGRPLQHSSGPHYLIPRGARFTSSAEIVLSTDRQVDMLLPCNPGNWSPDEWDSLIEGRLGPWAMATIDGRIISICHTPRAMTDNAAECGVWTDPDFRGQGHAAAVTAAWASILQPTGRHLFYSTDATNHSSRRVAARLHLRPIGWTWSLAEPGDAAGYQRHPLSDGNRPL